MPSYGEQSPLAYRIAAVSDEELLLQGNQGPRGQDEPREGHVDAEVRGWAAPHGFPVECSCAGLEKPTHQKAELAKLTAAQNGDSVMLCALKSRLLHDIVRVYVAVFALHDNTAVSGKARTTT